MKRRSKGLRLSFLRAGGIPGIRDWRLFEGFISKTGVRYGRRQKRLLSPLIGLTSVQMLALDFLHSGQTAVRRQQRKQEPKSLCTRGLLQEYSQNRSFQILVLRGQFLSPIP